MLTAILTAVCWPEVRPAPERLGCLRTQFLNGKEEGHTRAEVAPFDALLPLVPCGVAAEAHGRLLPCALRHLSLSPAEVRSLPV